MRNQELTLFLEQYYRLVGISPKKRERIIEILSMCKEIRDTEYPLKNSNVTELKIVEFTAHKDKDVYTINGSLQLKDSDQEEYRTFEANIIETNGEIKVYLDITRLEVEEEPRLIRTSDYILETGDTVLSVTRYPATQTQEETVFTDEFIKKDDTYNSLVINEKQLSIIL